jgi:hypothetical protein
MAFASRDCALRVCIGEFCLHAFCLIGGASEVRDKSGSSGGSHTRDVAICTALFFCWPFEVLRVRRVVMSSRLGCTELAAVVSSFVRRLPGDGGEGALEEGVVDDVAFVVFAFDDPVSGIGFAMAAVSEDGGGMSALCGIYEKRSAGTKGVHFSSPGGVVQPTICISLLRS